jgi:hypothetical protein
MPAFELAVTKFHLGQDVDSIDKRQSLSQWRFPLSFVLQEHSLAN